MSVDVERGPVTVGQRARWCPRGGGGPGREQDRLSSYEQHGLPPDRALDVEWVHGGRSLLEAIPGAGRGGAF